ncbi:MAG: superoxide dismutase family protein [Bacteroidales bacterium]|jgi:Cu-Zn family superoxide dismutase
MKKNYLTFLTVTLLITAFIASSFKFNNQNNSQGKIKKAICILYSTQGNKASGVINFIATDSGIKVTGNIQGLTKGKHGMHIHECGDCSATDGSSAGGHFNPMGKNHGGPMDMNRHEGDMGNIMANDSGKAHIEYIDKMLSFEGDNSIIGRSVIIHKSEDDFKTQPTGNSGARVACGVIGISK